MKGHGLEKLNTYSKVGKKLYNDRPFEILALFNCVFWAWWMKTSSTLKAVIEPPGSDCTTLRS